MSNPTYTSPFDQFLNTLPELQRTDSNTVVSITLSDLEQMIDAAWEDGFGDGFDEGVQADFEAEQEDAAEELASVSSFFDLQIDDDARVKAFFDDIASSEGGR